MRHHPEKRTQRYRLPVGEITHPARPGVPTAKETEFNCVRLIRSIKPADTRGSRNGIRGLGCEVGPDRATGSALRSFPASDPWAGRQRRTGRTAERSTRPLQIPCTSAGRAMLLCLPAPPCWKDRLPSGQAEIASGFALIDEDGIDGERVQAEPRRSSVACIIV
jgi:hypothetical protein